MDAGTGAPNDLFNINMQMPLQGCLILCIACDTWQIGIWIYLLCFPSGRVLCPEWLRDSKDKWWENKTKNNLLLLDNENRFFFNYYYFDHKVFFVRQLTFIVLPALATGGERTTGATGKLYSSANSAQWNWTTSTRFSPRTSFNTVAFEDKIFGNITD